MRELVIKQQHELCRTVINTLTTSIVVDVRKLYNDLPPDVVENDIKEFLGMQLYVDVQDAFADWFEHFHRRKPTDTTSANDTARGSFAKVFCCMYFVMYFKLLMLNFNY